MSLRSRVASARVFCRRWKRCVRVCACPRVWESVHACVCVRNNKERVRERNYSERTGFVQHQILIPYVNVGKYMERLLKSSVLVSPGELASIFMCIPSWLRSYVLLKVIWNLHTPPSTITLYTKHEGIIRETTYLSDCISYWCCIFVKDDINNRCGSQFTACSFR